MPPLQIRLKKGRDGSVALTCTRSDGSATWQRQTGASGAFFPLHDLTHFAVETELCAREGFFGLVASGWNVTDFGHPWPRGPLPAEAALVEAIVGFLDTERASGALWTADDVTEKLREYAATRLDGPLTAPPTAAAVTAATLARIRAQRGALYARWRDLPPGEALELRFDPDAANPGLETEGERGQVETGA